MGDSCQSLQTHEYEIMNNRMHVHIEHTNETRNKKKIIKMKNSSLGVSYHVFVFNGYKWTIKVELFV